MAYSSEFTEKLNNLGKKKKEEEKEEYKSEFIERLDSNFSSTNKDYSKNVTPINSYEDIQKIKPLNVDEFYNSQTQKTKQAETNFQNTLSTALTNENANKFKTLPEIRQETIKLPSTRQSVPTETLNPFKKEDLTENLKRLTKAYNDENVIKAREEYNTEYNKQKYANYLKRNKDINNSDISFFDRTLGVVTRAIEDLGSGFSDANRYIDENGKTNYLPSAADIKQQQVSNSYGDDFLGKIAKFGTDIGYQATKILGTEALNVVTAGVGGSSLYWTDMATDSYKQAINEGYDKENAMAYSLVNMGTEFITGKLLGGATSKLTGGSSKALENAIANKIYSKTGKATLSRIIGTMGSEASEEFVQEYLDNINKLITLDNSLNPKDYLDVITNTDILEDALYSAIVGAGSGGLVGSANVKSDSSIKNVKLLENFKSNLQESLNNEKNTTKKLVYENYIKKIDEQLQKGFSDEKGTEQLAQEVINNPIDNIQNNTQQQENMQYNTINLPSIETSQEQVENNAEMAKNNELEQNNNIIEEDNKKSSFSYDENARRYEDLTKTNNIEYFTKDNGSIRINMLDSNNNLVNQLDLISQNDAVKQLGEDLGNYIYQNSNENFKNIRLGNDINNLGTETDYFITHRPSETGLTGDNITNQDVETPIPKDALEHPEYYWNMQDKSVRESIDVLRKIQNNPDAEITIYRATPGDKINAGDWITLSKEYAKKHNDSQFDGKANILEMKVKAKDIQFAGDEINEFGYFPQNKNLFSENYKDIMQEYSQLDLDNLQTNKNNVILNKNDKLENYVEDAYNKKGLNKVLHLGVLKESIVDKIRKSINNFPKTGWKFNKNNYELAIREDVFLHLNDDKIRMSKEDAKEFAKKLPEIISDFDLVEYSKNDTDEGLRFRKRFDDGTYIAFTLTSDKKNRLLVKSIYMDKSDFENKKRSISPTANEKTLAKTSKTDGAFASIDNNTTKQQESQIKLPSAKQEIKLPTKENNQKISMPMIKQTSESIKVEAKQIADSINRIKDINMKERKFASSALQSETFKGKEIVKNLKLDNLNYVIDSNQASLDEANDRLSIIGYDSALNEVRTMVDRGDIPKPSSLVLAQRLLQEASKKGDIETVQELLMDISIIGTDLGKATQALSMIQKLTPEGQLRMYTKIVERSKARGEKSFNNVEITPKMVENVLSVYDENGNYDQNELNAKVEEFKQDIAKQLKTTKLEKVNSWRYLAMLGNPKTHIRNLVSNVAMKGTIKAKNAVARTLETIIPIESKTKTWKKASQEVKNFAKQTAIDMKGIITGEEKYNEKTSIESKKQIFKTKALEKVSNFNSNALEAEDWFFSKSAFISNFQEYLTANEIRTEQDIKNNPEIIEKGKLYAVEQAEIATFRQYSKLASQINRIEKNNKLARLGIEATVPFKKTPINVAKAGVKYSPLGLLKNISYDAYQLKKGNINASQFIDNVSQGLTGTSLTLIGYALAKAGFLTGSGDDDKEGKYDSQLGNTGYSIRIGGNNYSISWLSPVSMPMLVGANAYEQLEEGKDIDMNVVSDTLAKTLDPLSEMSFVSSLTDVLSSYSSGSNDMIKNIAETAGQSYILQFFPTLFSQLASTLDDKKRSTKVSNNSTWKFGGETIRKIMYKVPGLRNQLEASTDIWGNEKEQSENIIERAFENFLAPYSKTENISTKLDNEIKRVYNSTGETEVIPSVPYAYVKYKDETYRMSASEYTKYKETYGKTANKLLNNLISSNAYKKSTDDEKVKMMSSMYDFAKVKANEEYFKNTDVEFTNDTLKEYKKLQENEIDENSLGEYIGNKSIISTIYNDEKLTSQNKKEKIGDLLQDTELDDKQLGYLYSKYYSTEKNINNIVNAKIPMKEFIKFNSQSFESDYSEKTGKSISNSKKNKVINYINGLNLSIPQKAILIKSQYSSFKSYDNVIDKYINNLGLNTLDKAKVLKYANIDSYDNQIKQYVNSLNKTVSEKTEILKDMGFTVRNGRVY